MVLGRRGCYGRKVEPYQNLGEMGHSEPPPESGEPPTGEPHTDQRIGSLCALEVPSHSTDQWVHPSCL